MSGLFGGGSKAPAPPKPVPMPLIKDEKSRKKNRASVASQQEREGRTSTILSDKLGSS